MQNIFEQQLARRNAVAEKEFALYLNVCSSMSADAVLFCSPVTAVSKSDSTPSAASSSSGFSHALLQITYIGDINFGKKSLKHHLNIILFDSKQTLEIVIFMTKVS